MTRNDGRPLFNVLKSKWCVDLRNFCSVSSNEHLRRSHEWKLILVGKERTPRRCDWLSWRLAASSSNRGRRTGYCCCSEPPEALPGSYRKLTQPHHRGRR